MTRVAKKYLVYVLPLPRESTPDPSAGESTGTAHEFFFLQWGFRPAPPTPSTTEPNPFEPLMSGSSCRIPEPGPPSCLHHSKSTSFARILQRHTWY